MDDPVHPDILLPQLATIGLMHPSLTEQDHEDNTESDQWVITSNKESLTMPTWGINLGYLLKLVQACGGRETLSSFTTANICKLLVKPLTAEHQGSVCEVLLEQGRFDAVQPANWFVSHAWQCNFMDMDFDGGQVYPRRGDGIAFFMDDPIPLKRSWCTLEVLACDLGAERFHVALSPRENERLLKDLQDEQSHSRMLSRISCEKSQSTNDDDRVKIFEIIKLVTSFSKLDQLGLNTYNISLTKRLEQQLEKTLHGGLL
ncbi:hypothetical protein HDU76_005715 [Blyttiomyces sp. JEL0837]|nr:hypothetical protein HDU76_005715 [Blyttiomyces sp. JEL0837]